MKLGLPVTDDLLKLDNQFCFTAYAVARAVTQAYEPLLHALELTYPQYLVMLALWEEDEVNLKTLGQRLRLDSGTLTPIIKRLQSKGYLTKQRSALDERELVIALTPGGRKLREQALSVPHGLLCRLNIPLAKVGKLRDELKQLLSAMDQVDPDLSKKMPENGSGSSKEAVPKSPKAPTPKPVSPRRKKS